MDDAWAQCLAMLYQPTQSTVQWPADLCRQVSQWPHQRPPTKPPTVVVTRVDATDDSVLQALRTRDFGALDLARLFGTSRRAMSGQLLRLHQLGLVSGKADGIWQIVP